jgi:hypothetical protein
MTIVELLGHGILLGPPRGYITRMTALARARSNCKLHPSSCQRMLHNDYIRKCSVEKNTGRESQGAWRQDELMGGKQPVVK